MHRVNQFVAHVRARVDADEAAQAHRLLPGSTASLFSVDGEDLIGIGIKSGLFYALDRDTGMMQWMTMITEGSALGGVISAPAYADDKLFTLSTALRWITSGVLWKMKYRTNSLRLAPHRQRRQKRLFHTPPSQVTAFMMFTIMTSNDE